MTTEHGFSDIYEAIYVKCGKRFSDRLIQAAISNVIAHCPEGHGWGWAQVFACLINKKVVYKKLEFQPIKPTPPTKFEIIMGSDTASYDALQARIRDFLGRADKDAPRLETRFTEARRRRLAFCKRQPFVGMNPPIGKLPESDMWERE